MHAKENTTISKSYICSTEVGIYLLVNFLVKVCVLKLQLAHPELKGIGKILEGRGFEIYESVFLDKEDFVQHLSKRKFVDFIDVEFRRDRHNFFKLETFLSSAIVSNLLCSLEAILLSKFTLN